MASTLTRIKRTDAFNVTDMRPQYLFNHPGLDSTVVNPPIAAPASASPPSKNIPLGKVPYGNLRKDSEYLEKNLNCTVPTLEAHYGNGESLFLTKSLSMLDFLEESYPWTYAPCISCDGHGCALYSPGPRVTGGS